MEQYEFAWHSGLFLMVCLLLFFVAKLVFKVFNFSININDELTQKDNTAFYLGYLSYFTGFLMIIGGIMTSEGSGGIWEEIGYTFAYGLAGMVILNLASIFMDKIVHPKIALWDEIIHKKNVSIGIIKGVNYLGTGVIISGVMLTEVDKPVEAGIFLIFAMVIASLGFLYYNLITPFNIREEIYNQNTAVAISTAGAQIAFAILIYAGFQIQHTDWTDSLVSIGIDILGGFLLLPIIRYIVDKLFITNRKLTDELINQEVPNIGAGMFEAAAYIAGALLFVWCWHL